MKLFEADNMTELKKFTTVMDIIGDKKSLDGISSYMRNNQCGYQRCLKRISGSTNRNLYILKIYASNSEREHISRLIKLKNDDITISINDLTF